MESRARDASPGFAEESTNAGNGQKISAETFGVRTSAADVKFTAILADGDSDSDTSSVEDCIRTRTSDDEGTCEKTTTSDDVVLRSTSMRHAYTNPDIHQSLSMKDDHFAPPEGCFDGSSMEELESAIEKYKQLARRVTPHTDQAKDLIRKLVQLRLKLMEAKEEPSMTNRNVKQVMGHSLIEKPWGSAQGYCEKCNGMILGIVQSWLKCSECGFCCHRSCLNVITRTCAKAKVMENPSFSLVICPERGLNLQSYRCMECRIAIGFQPGMHEPRLCDYTGAFYCDHCHWNDTMAIPARILSNWDFEPKKVSRASKQFLKLMLRRPVLCIQDINPMLFSYLGELNDVKKLREEILMMKQYFLQCTEALRINRLLCQLQHRQHFVENSDMYSLQDLIDLANDVLLPEVTKIHASFAQHIKTDCEKCRMKGYVCVICEDDEHLFPFDNTIFICPNCTTVLHRDCYQRRNKNCLLCQRKEERSKRISLDDV